MYCHCVYCFQRLEPSGARSASPVGLRIAFDPVEGRLWIVCRNCRRWILTPQEGRAADAVARCDERFAALPVRASSANVGLVRDASGVDLIRVGAGNRLELAHWRYGVHHEKRWQRKAALAGGGTPMPGIGLGLSVVGLLVGVLASASLMTSGRSRERRPTVKSGVWLPDREGCPRVLSRGEVQAARLVSFPEGSFELDVGARRLVGDEAESIAAILLPRLNRAGADRRAVNAAVRHIDRSGGPLAFIKGLPGIGEPLLPLLTDLRDQRERGARFTTISALPQPMRLALEMALHEAREERVARGDTTQLELDWVHAHEVATLVERGA